MRRRSRVELDPKFRRLMQRLDKDLTEPLKREIAASGEKVFREATLRVPVDTGELRDSIGFRVGAFSAEVGFDPKRFRAKWRRAGWRAHFTHNGTKGSAKHNIPPQPPRPFLRDAFDANKREIQEQHRKAVATVLRKAGGDG